MFSRRIYYKWTSAGENLAEKPYWFKFHRNLGTQKKIQINYEKLLYLDV